LDILPVDVVEEYWKGDCGLRSVVDGVYDTSSFFNVSAIHRCFNQTTFLIVSANILVFCIILRKINLLYQK